MPRDAHIPLFLWIATALVVHLLGGGGVHEAATWLEERIDLQRFAQGVRSYVKSAHEGTLEVTLDDPADLPPPPEPEPVPDPQAEAQPTPENEDADAPDRDKPDEPKETERETPKPEVEKKREAEKKLEVEKDARPVEPLVQKKAIAVRQHVKDKDQKDNPDAEFLAEDNNRVSEQTQARITSNDQNDPDPTPGSNASGVGEQPGNAHETRVAHSEERAGEEAQAPSDEPAPQRPDTDARPPNAGAPEATARSHTAPSQPGAASATGPEGPAERAAQGATATGSKGQAEQVAQAGSPELLAHNQGTLAAPDARIATPQQQGQRARKKRELPRRKSRGYEDLLGLGASGTTASGINLNLTPGLARDAIGVDQLSREKRADGARRRSQHLGSWKMAGIERWRSSIENYVPSVKPGNQTALNTARSPFGTYLSLIHNRLHPIFADWFLGSLDSLPSNHPMNRPEMSTNLEIVLDEAEGKIVKMGITKTSGVTAFDIAALDSVQRASPFGPPPREIVSGDGNVYLHWEFHRNPWIACTTFNARPYILKVQPKPAPAPVPPPSDERPPDDERHGARERSSNSRVAQHP